MNSDKLLPTRKRLSHTPPVSVSHIAADAVFFVTICVDRTKYGISGDKVGREGPLTGNAAVRLLCTFQHYVSIGQLALLRVVIMPDHVHIVLRAKQEVPFARAIAHLKAWVSKSLGIVWQRGFFDHRLRNDESFYEKSLYVAMNPVRKGLCSAPEQWPYAMTWE